MSVKLGETLARAKKNETTQGDPNFKEKTKLEETTYKNQRHLTTSLNCLLITFIALFGIFVIYYLALTAFPPLKTMIGSTENEAEMARKEIGEIILKVLSFIAGGVIGRPILKYFKTEDKF